MQQQNTDHSLAIEEQLQFALNIRWKGNCPSAEGAYVDSPLLSWEQKMLTLGRISDIAPLPLYARQYFESANDPANDNGYHILSSFAEKLSIEQFSDTEEQRRFEDFCLVIQFANLIAHQLDPFDFGHEEAGMSRKNAESFYQLLQATLKDSNWQEAADKIRQTLAQLRPEEVEMPDDVSDIKDQQFERSKQSLFNLVDRVNEEVYLLARDYISDRHPALMKEAKKSKDSLFCDGGTNQHHDTAFKQITRTILSGCDVDGKPVYPPANISDILQMGLRLQRSPGDNLLKKPGMLSRALSILRKGSQEEERYPTAQKRYDSLIARTAGLDGKARTIFPRWLGRDENGSLPFTFHQNDLDSPYKFEPVEAMFTITGLYPVIRKLEKKTNSQIHSPIKETTDGRTLLRKTYISLNDKAVAEILNAISDNKGTDNEIASSKMMDAIEDYRKEAVSQWHKLKTQVFAPLDDTATAEGIAARLDYIKEKQQILQHAGLKISALQETIMIVEAATNTAAHIFNTDEAYRQLEANAEHPLALIHASTLSADEVSPDQHVIARAALQNGASRFELPPRNADLDAAVAAQHQTHYLLSDACEQAIYAIDDIIETNMVPDDQAQKMLLLRESLFETGEQAEQIVKRMAKSQTRRDSAREQIANGR